MRGKFATVALLGLLFAGKSWAQDECTLTISGNDQIQYDKKELSISSACKQVTLTLHHSGMLQANIMGHNWVLTKTEDFMPVAQAAQAAGPPNFIPANDDRIIAHTTVIGGGEEVSVTFDLSRLEAGGDYTYFCTFPGHFVLMNGKFIVE